MFKNVKRKKLVKKRQGNYKKRPNWVSYDKNRNAEMKNTLHWINNRLDTKEEKINALENNNKSAQNEEGRKNIWGEIDKNFQICWRLCIHRSKKINKGRRKRKGKITLRTITTKSLNMFKAAGDFHFQPRWSNRDNSFQNTGQQATKESERNQR